MKNSLFQLMVLLSLAFTSCAPTNSFKTEKIGDENKLKNTSLVYALPQTKIMFYLDVDRQTKIPGPYYIYANKYLGINRVIDMEEENYNIADFKLQTLQIPDPQEYYRVDVKKSTGVFQEMLEYSDLGLILTDLHSDYTIDKSESEQTIDFKYKDLSMSSNFYYSYDTFYKTVLTDSAFVKLPVVKSQINEKSTDQKAREVSELIYTLRKERYRIITEALETTESASMFREIIDEIDRLEKEYMALFEGKYYSEKLHYVFSIVPELDSTGVFETDICCYSYGQGVMPLKEGCETMKARITVLNPETNLDKLEPLPQGKPVSNAVFYRLPVQARLEVVFKNDLLFESMVSISQSGKILPIKIGN